MRGLIGAVQFLTRIPIRTARPVPAANTVPWYPLVGALIGLAVGGVAALMMELVPDPVAAAVAVVAGLLLTGAFHEDGLADMSDAVAGGFTRERRLEILDDSLHGSYGVAALCGSILLRTLALATLGPAAAFAGSVGAHSLGRGAAVVVLATQSPAGTDGLGAERAATVRRPAALFGAAAGAGLAAIAVGWWVLPCLAAAAAGAVVVVAIARRAFGGINGDVLGTIEQVGECLVLVTVTGLASRHALWWT